MSATVNAGMGTRVREGAGTTVRQPWMVALVGALAMWVFLIIVGQQQSAFGLLTSNAFLASFTAIAALGQMLVISGGDGAIDLSIPKVITFSVYVVTLLQGGENIRLPLAILATVAIGALFGAVSGFLVVVMRVPAIVATLAVGFIVDSGVIILSNVPGRGQASPILAAVARNSFLWIPLVAWIAIIFTVIVAVLVWRTGFGLRIMAAGQNAPAARMAGLKPTSARFITFVLSGTFASITGILLSAYANGAFLGIGSDYLMASIAAVVLGGTIMMGGRPSVVGALLGALFLSFVLTTTNTLAIPPGARLIVQGVIILGALAIGTARRKDR